MWWIGRGQIVNEQQVEYIRIGPDDLEECYRIANEHQQVARELRQQNQKIAHHKSDLEIMAEGIIGEYAVAQTLGLGGFEMVSVCGKDQRGDIELPTGDFIEVKATGRVRNNFLIEGGDIPVLFQATYGVAVWILPPQASSVLDYVPYVDVGVVGWCDHHIFNIRKHWFGLKKNGDPMPRPTWGMRWFDLEPLDSLRDRLAWYPVNQHNQQVLTPTINS